MIPVTDVLRVHPRDNVLVALRDLQPGETVRLPGDELVVKSVVPSATASVKSPYGRPE
jgi:hypothetical protein